MKNFILFAVAAMSLAACASGPKDSGGADGPRASVADPGRLLAYARQLRQEKGCAKAAPAYRVVAGMGGGFEAGQHELGECLLSMTGASETETALFRQEGEFWLMRAAYAGNARAQRVLATHFGAADNAHAAPVDALKWSLVYAKNGDADLYGFKALPATFEPGLRRALAAHEIAAAEAFAAEFKPIKLASFEAPRMKNEGARSDRSEGPPRGKSRRRRQ